MRDRRSHRCCRGMRFANAWVKAFFERLWIPRYAAANRAHREVAVLSRQAHLTRGELDSDDLQRLTDAVETILRD